MGMYQSLGMTEYACKLEEVSGREKTEEETEGRIDPNRT